ncbi:MAG: hypothetical protein ABI824_18220 [Acidobacteriota bacterium]
MNPKPMTLKRVIAYVLLFAMSQTALLAKSTPLQLRWTELASLIVTQKVELTLKDGSKVRGEAIAVREETLLVDVARSSGATHYNRGSGEIPRNSITLIQVQKTGGAWGRRLGTTVGLLVGFGVGGNAAFHTNSAGAGTAVFVGIAAGIGVLGYYVGRSLDTRETQITILP